VSERYRGLVAVVAYHLGPDRVRRWPQGGYGVPAPYLEALRRAGARTAIVSPGEEADAETTLAAFDGLLLVGGGDVDPAVYGADPSAAHVYGVEPDRDAFEIALLHAADRLAMPVLCICRGMQVMNVAFGGTLHVHLPDRPGLIPHGVPLEETEADHPVEPLAGSRLAAATKSGTLTCRSHHHQGVDRVGDGLVATGWSPDGLVEAIERVVPDQQDEFATWMLGVQWHPEETAATDPAQQRLFDALALLARLRGTRARPGEQQGRGRALVIAEPDPSWPERFDEEATAIRAALGDRAIRIEHVGSTSVPGLAAKPVIDIQVSVASMAPFENYAGPLAAAGFRHVLDPWSDEHEFFSREEGESRSVNLHVCNVGSTWERRHLAFRDHLRTHPEDVRAYEDLKRRLVATHVRDPYTYTYEKGGFIRARDGSVEPPGGPKD
jgi:putative glutamine amidotransferase